mgnify:CR=1 FL=1
MGAAREALQALIETMPGVDHLTVTHNIADDRHGYNLALFSGFESKEACEIFLRHPEYQRVMKDELEPMIDQKLVAQGVDEVDRRVRGDAECAVLGMLRHVFGHAVEVFFKDAFAKHGPALTAAGANLKTVSWHWHEQMRLLHKKHLSRVCRVRTLWFMSR